MFLFYRCYEDELTTRETKCLSNSGSSLDCLTEVSSLSRPI